MHTRAAAWASVLAATIALATPPCAARDLSFEERVRAQEALERVQYAHQIGATVPFDEAVPREVLERKVRLVLRQSAALEKFWGTSITAEALRREVERMVRGTRMPGRLREMFAALGDDPLLIEECLARPALAGRRVHDLYAGDDRFHAAARSEAEALRAALREGRIDPRTDHPRRTVVDLVRGAAQGPGGESADPRLELTAAEFDFERARLAQGSGGASSVREERSRFTVSVLLEEQADRLRVARFSVAKRSHDAWWSEVEAQLDERSVATVATGADPIAAWLAALADQAGPGADSETTGVPCAGNDTWDNGVLDDGPFPHHAPLAVWTGSRMLVWGGERYDPATDTWTPLSTTNAPPVQLWATVVWTGSEMIVWGGGFPPNIFNTGGRYDPLTDSWTPTTTAGAPAPRTFHTAVWDGSAMIVWGGYDGAPLATGGRYDPSTDTWTPTSMAGAPAARGRHTAVWSGETMLVWGGFPVSATQSTGGRYDPVNDAWEPMSTANAAQPRGRHTAVWSGTEMIVWGGDEGETLNTGGRYDPVADTWSPMTVSGAPEPRLYHTAVWAGDRMIVWGGSADHDFGPPNLDTGGSYDPVEDAWSPTSATNAPPPRNSHAGIWTGSQMIVWGGLDDEGLDSGGRYDPSSDTWTPTSSTLRPEIGPSHTAVWTGSQMILWGGGDGSTALNSGGRYDPALDTWTPTSTLNAPLGRFYHTAVWTGSRMIVWGGRYFGALGNIPGLDTGGRYDPLSDTWDATSTFHAPTPRWRHSAIWTGSKMVVWGGTPDFSATLATGGRYDPATDAWLAPLPTANAPQARQRHTAVWTGSEMIVWGGENATSLSSGGRYDPATNAWLGPTATTNEPAARARHTAVWTGAEMVVWGGIPEGGAELASGGRYDPAADAWLPTSASGAPSARYLHTAVWTGESMVVWGGADFAGNYFATGARYDPSADAWSPTSTSVAPSPRAGHTAVWTGGLMIVWGGEGPSPTVYTGGRWAFGNAIDDDGDGLSECDGDCNDVEPGAFAVPAEVAGLVFEDGATLAWQSALPGSGSSTVHDVIRGTLDDPVAGGDESCLATTTAPTATDGEPPPGGSGFWYLVRGRNVCGPGTYGTQSDGTPRSSTACP